VSDISQDTARPRSPSSELDGYPLVVFGHRPPELGGYEDNPLQRSIRRRLQDGFRAKAELHDDLMIVSGMALGVEMIAAEAAALAGVPYTVVLAYPDFDAPWPDLTRRRFDHIVDGAARVVTLQKHQPKSRQQFAPAFARRDAWLRKNAAEAVMVWDGSDAALGKLYRSLVDAVGEEEVWVIDPAELGS
jgi:uncharacterized phage-like protein YoqJ